MVEIKSSDENVFAAGVAFGEHLCAVIDRELPDYYSVPEQLYLQNTFLPVLLRHFKQTADKDLLMTRIDIRKGKGVRYIPTATKKIIAGQLKRADSLKYWNIEYGQGFCTVKNKVIGSGVIRMDVDSGSLEWIVPSGYSYENMGLTVHTHPDSTIFSANDMKVLSRTGTPPVMIVASDEGFFLAHRTLETDEYQGLDVKCNKAYHSRTELIQDILQIGIHHKMPIYYAPNNSSIFTRFRD